MTNRPHPACSRGPAERAPPGRRRAPGAPPPRAPPPPPLSFEQGGNALDQGRLVDRLAMADDLDLEGAHDIADEAHSIDAAARRHQGRPYGEESVAAAERHH